MISILFFTGRIFQDEVLEKKERTMMKKFTVYDIRTFKNKTTKTEKLNSSYLLKKGMRV